MIWNHPRLACLPHAEGLHAAVDNNGEGSTVTVDIQPEASGSLVHLKWNPVQIIRINTVQDNVPGLAVASPTTGKLPAQITFWTFKWGETESQDQLPGSGSQEKFIKPSYPWLLTPLASRRLVCLSKHGHIYPGAEYISAGATVPWITSGTTWAISVPASQTTASSKCLLLYKDYR